MTGLQPQDQNTWMVAYVTNNLSEAHIVVGRLQNEGIMAILDHMAGMSAIGVTIGSWGEVRVLVHPHDYDVSQAILFPDEPMELENDTSSVIYIDDDYNDEQ